MSLLRNRTYRVMAWVVLLLTASATAQDAVKLSGFWIEPVQVSVIRDGQVFYTTGQGVQLSRPMSSLEGLRLQRYPALSEAQEALDRGDDPAAAKLYKQVADSANEDWVRFYAGSRRVSALSRLDEAEDAVGQYLELLMGGADLAYVAQPPVDTLARADAAVRLRAIELIKAAQAGLDEQRAELLRKLLEAAGQPQGVLEPDVDITDRTITHHTGLVLSSSVPPGSVVNFYRNGRLDRAMIAVDEALAQPGRTASELYLKGMIQLALAEQSSDPAGYKSAGLSFMRVVTYFPRSAVAGCAWMEAGYVHEKIGRADIAAALYERAKSMIDEVEDPDTYARLNGLIAGLNPDTHEK